MAAEIKTKPTKASVSAFLKKQATGERLEDCKWLVTAMEKATRSRGVMWGASIAGFGTYTATYASGATVDWMLVGFSPRKPSLVLYGIRGAMKKEPALARKLGKVKLGGGCIYLKSLADVDKAALTKLIALAVKLTKARSKA